jgi:hypothetical protein
MLTDSAHTADILVNATALTGLVFALAAVPRGAKASAIDEKLGLLYGWLLLFLIARQVFWLIPGYGLTSAIMALAAWLPLVILLLVEEVVRRHAPRHLKWLSLACGLAFSIVALWAGRQWPVEALSAFGAAVGGLLLLIGIFILRNRRRDLTVAETSMADSIGLALLLCVPLAVTEFRGLFPEMPVALGTPAILLFCVMSAALATGIGSPSRFVFDVAALSLTAGAVGVLTHWLAPVLTRGDLIRIGVLTFCVCAAMLIIYRLNESHRLGLKRQSIIGAMAQLPDGADEDALIGAHPVTAGGTILQHAQLTLYGADIEAMLSRHTVISRITFAQPDAAVAVRNLLDEHGATHLVRLSSRPLRLLALSCGALGDTESIETELAVFSRLAEKGGAC